MNPSKSWRHWKEDFEDYLEALQYSEAPEKTKTALFRHLSEELKKQLRTFDLKLNDGYAKNGLWQLPLDEESSYLITFCTPWRRKGIKPNPKKISATEEFSTPNCKEDLQIFLGKSRQIKSQHWALVRNHTIQSPRLQRMLPRLNKYTIQMEYIPGKNLVIADALSRAQSTTDNFDEVLGQDATV
ncbi:hypothetical protein TNCV_3463351 [Trichonephila clavipes]|nr:hypothetical protein TNCV_3463351 [Trichonephila clavipes]